MAVFGLVQSTDLDPIQAVRAALAMGRELEQLNARLGPKFGVQLQMRTGMTSLLPHYPPCYGREKTMKSLRLFAEPFMPPCRASRRATVAAG